MTNTANTNTNNNTNINKSSNNNNYNTTSATDNNTSSTNNNNNNKQNAPYMATIFCKISTTTSKSLHKTDSVDHFTRQHVTLAFTISCQQKIKEADIYNDVETSSSSINSSSSTLFDYYENIQQQLIYNNQVLNSNNNTTTTNNISPHNLPILIIIKNPLCIYEKPPSHMNNNSNIDCCTFMTVRDSNQVSFLYEHDNDQSNNITTTNTLHPRYVNNNSTTNNSDNNRINSNSHNDSPINDSSKSYPFHHTIVGFISNSTIATSWIHSAYSVCSGIMAHTNINNNITNNNISSNNYNNKTTTNNNHNNNNNKNNTNNNKTTERLNTIYSIRDILQMNLSSLISKVLPLDSCVVGVLLYKALSYDSEQVYQSHIVINKSSNTSKRQKLDNNNSSHNSYINNNSHHHNNKLKLRLVLRDVTTPDIITVYVDYIIHNSYTNITNNITSDIPLGTIICLHGYNTLYKASSNKFMYLKSTARPSPPTLISSDLSSALTSGCNSIGLLYDFLVLIMLFFCYFFI